MLVIIFKNNHVPDLFRGCVDDKATACKHYENMQVELADDPSEEIKTENRILNILDQFHQG